MPVFLAYRCGCREDRDTVPPFPACPMHGEPAVRALAASPSALDAKYGPQPPLPPGGLFYPSFDGLGHWRGAD